VVLDRPFTRLKKLSILQLHFTPLPLSTAMSPADFKPAHLQTRAKNADQHPGLAVPKQKRCTQAEMNEAREKQRLEAEAAKKDKEEKLLAVAKLEDAIAARDKLAAGGTVDRQARVTSAAKVKKALPAPKAVQKAKVSNAVQSLYNKGTHKITGDRDCRRIGGQHLR
jgi:hypothetical protein